VSSAARKTIFDHLGGDAVVVPNGVHVGRYAAAAPLSGWQRCDAVGTGGTIGFVGRVDEPRKGLQVLFDALPIVREEFPDVQVVVAGPGEPPSPLPRGVTMLGRVSDADKARLYASVDVFAAPNTGGESFGIILLEAMSAGSPIVASNLEAFSQVLEGGRLGELTKVGDPASFAAGCASLLRSVQRRTELREAARAVVTRYDWSVVVGEILRVYETAIAASTGHVEEDPESIDTAAFESQLQGL
jgi:phosphatidylinositol alpha-mannosyltransferase